MGFWIPAPVFTRAGFRRNDGYTKVSLGEDNGGDEDGSPHARGQREGVGASEEVWEDGFLPAETFAKLPKRIQIAVWDDSCHS